MVRAPAAAPGCVTARSCTSTAGVLCRRAGFASARDGDPVATHRAAGRPRRIPAIPRRAGGRFGRGLSGRLPMAAGAGHRPADRGACRGLRRRFSGVRHRPCRPTTVAADTGGVVGISPLLDIDCAVRDTHPNSALDPLIRAAALPLIMEHARVLDGVADPSPVNGDLSAFPPSLIIAADSETLRCDAERMYTALIDAGRVCVLKVWPRQVHAFPRSSRSCRRARSPSTTSPSSSPNGSPSPTPPLNGERLTGEREPSGVSPVRSRERFVHSGRSASPFRRPGCTNPVAQHPG